MIQGRATWTRSPIIIHYIHDRTIHYTCTACKKDHVLTFDTQDAQQDWFRFLCQTRKCHAKRIVNLRKVVT